MSFDFTQNYETDNVLAEGWYDVYVDAAEYKTSKTSGIDYLNLKFKNRSGAVLFNIYNVFNKNDTARNIAIGDIKKILTLQGSDIAKLKTVSKEELLELLVSPRYFQVALTVFEDSYGKKNKIKKYKEIEVAEIKKVQDGVISEDIPF